MVNANTNFDRADANARQVIHRTKQITRRRFNPEEKVRIVIEEIRGEIKVTSLWRREDIASNVYYKLLKDFMEAGKGQLEGATLQEAGRAEVQSLQRKNERLKELVGAWGAATLEERHQLLTMMLDAVYVDMTQGLVLGLKPKPEFLLLFNLGEPVTTGDSALVTGGVE